MSDRGKLPTPRGGDVPGGRLSQQLEWECSSEVHGPKFVSPEDLPRVRLVVFGAVPLAVELTRAARMLGWVPYVVDPRARFATRERFPDAEEVVAAWPEEALAELGAIDPATSVAVLTHDPKLDDAVLHIALRSPARFIGAMGSKRAQAKRRGAARRKPR